MDNQVVDWARTMYWREKAHASLESGYTSAIANYQQQRDQFIKQISQETQVEADKWMEDLNASILEESNDELDEQFLEMYQQIEKDLIQVFTNAKDTHALNELQQRLMRIDNKTKQEIPKTFGTMKQYIDQFLKAQDITKTGLMKYLPKNISSSNTDIANNLYGAARKVLYRQLLGLESQTNFSNYKKVLKGYYKEDVITNVLMKFLEKYNVSARQAGSVTNTKNQQIKIDIVLGSSNLNKVDDKAFEALMQQYIDIPDTSVSYSINGNTYSMLGGIQSKSWLLPLDITKNTKAYGNRNFQVFGNGSDLLQSLPEVDLYYWHACLDLANNNLLKIIGPNNFIYATGEGIYWTSELLKTIREKYVLSFYFSTKTHLPTGEITLQEHLDK